MRADFWTKERVATLKRLWAEGASASVIGKKLGGISRSAVLGKIFRLRLGGAHKPAKAPGQKAKAGGAKPGRARLKDQPARRRSDKTQDAAASRATTHKSLLELTNTCCRWPHGRPGAKTFFFCGAPGADVESGVPYCALHMQRAYVVAPANTVTPWRVVSRAA
jgi:GcrA cell cycle regulator